MGPAPKKADEFLFKGAGPDLRQLQANSRRELRLKARSQWLLAAQAAQAQQQKSGPTPPTL